MKDDCSSQELAQAHKPTRKDSRRKRRWFMCDLAGRPSDEAMAGMMACGVTDLRWCHEGATVPPTMKAFLFRPCGMYEVWWARSAMGWKLSPPDTASPKIHTKIRSESLWEAYAAGKGPAVREELLRNRLPRPPPGPTPAVPALPEARWRGLLTAFLRAPQPLGGPITMLAVARSMFPDAVPPGCRRFVCATDATGLQTSSVQPRKQQGSYAISSEGGDTSALELHRRVLRLERAAADLAHYLRQAARLNEASFACQEQAVRDDLACVLRFGGGLCGGGGEFWVARRADDFDAGRSNLMLVIQLLRGSRQSAFAREYALVEDVTWGLPVVCRLAVTLQATPLATPQRLVETLTHFFRIRAHIIDQEKQPLLVYGAHLTCYCRRLQQLAMLAGPLPPHLHVPRLTPQGGLQVYTLEGYVLAPAPGEGPIPMDAAIPIDERFCNGPFTAPPEVRAMVLRRQRQEGQEAEDVVSLLGMRAPPALSCLRRFQRIVLACMQDDSHLKNATMHLAPTASLRNAVFDAAQYLT